MANKVVVHYLDGRIEKGLTSDFRPQRDIFHLIAYKDDREMSIPVKIEDLKAVFFVKEMEGNGKILFQKKKTFQDEEIKERPLIGKKVKVTFTDGEVLYGLTFGFSQERRGFFFNPIDPKDNNERIFALWNAVKDIKFYE